METQFNGNGKTKNIPTYPDGTPIAIGSDPGLMTIIRHVRIYARIIAREFVRDRQANVVGIIDQDKREWRLDEYTPVVCAFPFNDPARGITALERKRHRSVFVDAVDVRETEDAFVDGHGRTYPKKLWKRLDPLAW